jgi:hypothetical protein
LTCRYVGAQIGIHNPDGEKVGRVCTCATSSTSRVGDRELVEELCASQEMSP